MQAKLRVTRAIAWMLLTTLVAASTLARDSDERDFSPEERSDLEAGKLVVRREQLTRGDAHLIGGFSWQVIDAGPAEVWKAVTNLDAYPHFLPAVAEAKALERVGYDQRLYIRHRTPLVETSYCVLAHHDDASRTFRFRLDRTRAAAIDDAWGELRVTPYSGGRSVVSLAIMADLGSGMIARLMRGQVHEWMLRIPQQLQRYVLREKRKHS
jgi:hypothetical protein